MKENGKKFEIVFASSDRDEAAFDEYFAEMPWISLPYANRDAKEALSKKFKVQGIPTLVIIDKDGTTITTDGRSAVTEDPTGQNFPWHPPTFADSIGDTLIRNDGTEVKYSDLAGKTIAIYFSAHWCPPCRGFTPELAKIYNGLKAAGKKLEIVFASSDKDEASFKEYFAEMPWLALPYSDRQTKDALSKKFKVQGIPTLVFVDKEGKTITTDGRSAVMEDREGKNFPWIPPTFGETMAGATLVRGDGTELAYSELAGKTIGFYFSAHWCPPCRGFTPELVKTYKKVVDAGKDFEIIFASSDKNEASFKEYFGEMPWLALKYSERETKEALSKVFGVNGIPSFHIVEHDGTVINNNGRGAVDGDPEGAEFPWHPKPVNDLSAGPGDINETPSVVVLMEEAADKVKPEQALVAVATPILAKAKEAGEDAPFCFLTGKSAGGITDRVRELLKAGEDKSKPQLFLLDIPDNGGYYKADVDEVTVATIEAFLEKYKSKSLERQQLG